MNIISQISVNINQANINKKQNLQVQTSLLSTTARNSNLSVPYDCFSSVTFSGCSVSHQKIIDKMKIEERNINVYIRNINGCLPNKYHMDPEKTGYDGLINALKKIKTEVNKALKEIEEENELRQVKDKDIPFILEIQRRRFGIGYKKLHIQTKIMEEMGLKESRFIRLNDKANELLYRKLEGISIRHKINSKNMEPQEKVQQTKNVKVNLKPAKKFKTANFTNLNTSMLLDEFEEKTQLSRKVEGKLTPVKINNQVLRTKRSNSLADETDNGIPSSLNSKLANLENLNTKRNNFFLDKLEQKKNPSVEVEVEKVVYPNKLKFDKSKLRFYISNFNKCLPDDHKISLETPYYKLDVIIDKKLPVIKHALKSISKEDDPDIPTIINLLKLRFGIDEEKYYLQSEIMKELNLTEDQFKVISKKANNLLCRKMGQKTKKSSNIGRFSTNLSSPTISKIVNSLRTIFGVRLVEIRSKQALIDKMNEKLISGKSMKEVLEYRITNFSQTEQGIIEHYFGLNGKKILTNSQIKDKFNLLSNKVPNQIVEKLLYRGKKPHKSNKHLLIKDGSFTKSRVKFLSTIFPDANIPKLRNYDDLVKLLNARGSNGKSMKESLEEALNRIVKQYPSKRKIFEFKNAVELFLGLNWHEMSTFEKIQSELDMSNMTEVYKLFYNQKRIDMLIANIPAEQRLDSIIYGFDINKLTGKANNLSGNQSPLAYSQTAKMTIDRRKIKQKEAAIPRIKTVLYGIFKRKFKITNNFDLVEILNSPYSADKSKKMIIEESIKDLSAKDKCIIRDCLGLDGELLNNTEIVEKHGLENADDHIKLLEKHLYNSEKIVINKRDGSATKYRINLLTNLLPDFNVPQTVKYDELCDFLNSKKASDKTVKDILLETFEQTSKKFPDDIPLLMQMKAIKLWLGFEDGMEMLNYNEIKAFLINKYEYKHKYDDMSSFINKKSGLAKIRANIPVEYKMNSTASGVEVCP